MLIASVEKTTEIPGDIIECGVYQGHSALKILQHTSKTVWLVDSFLGLPEPGPEDMSLPYHRGDLQGDYNIVRELLRDYPKAEIVKGWIPECLKPLSKRVFCMAHLDLDLYKSTKDALTFIVPHMSLRGIILIHDIALPGIQRAIEECGLMGESNGEYFKWVK